YLNQYQLLPQKRTSEFFGDVFGRSVGEGTLNNFVSDCATALGEFGQELKAGIGDSKVVHFDETKAMSGYWVHVASTGNMTYYAVHPNRGHKAMDEIGILPTFQGSAVHDGLVAYKKYPCRHVLCNAHHQRELVAVKEDENVEWAAQMLDFLHDVKKSVDEAKEKDNDCLESKEIKNFEERYEKIVKTGFEAYPPEPISAVPIKKRGRKKQSKGKNLLDRFKKNREQILAFMYDFKIPYDNNQAERDLRMIKLKIKISGTFRSKNGILNFCRIRSFISTMRKQGQRILQSLSNVFAGKSIAVQFT
ncbi:MAG: IS66 family transposase, partial [Desulfomonile tiedjei]|nr:IS66 family transposase [Desulfomonile tiedjei]